MRTHGCGQPEEPFSLTWAVRGRWVLQGPGLTSHRCHRPLCLQPHGQAACRPARLRCQAALARLGGWASPLIAVPAAERAVRRRERPRHAWRRWPVAPAQRRQRAGAAGEPGTTSRLLGSAREECGREEACRDGAHRLPLVNPAIGKPPQIGDAPVNDARLCK